MLLVQSARSLDIISVNYHLPNDPCAAPPQGRTTLLVGPPGAGKSVLLQLLAGHFKNTAFCHITGDVKYNGKDKSEFVIQRTAGLVDQYDEHIANLTVHETLDFATACQVGKVKGSDHIVKVQSVVLCLLPPCSSFTLSSHNALLQLLQHLLRLFALSQLLSPEPDC